MTNGAMSRRTSCAACDVMVERKVAFAVAIGRYLSGI